jgi:hypothetical protein
MPLPTFIIIGAARAGTTSLYHYFREHPDVFMSPVKEVNFFSRERLAANWHPRKLKRYEVLFEGAEDHRAVGEASPLYLPSPTAPGLMARVLPDVRLIVSIRNPIERAWSAWQGEIREGREPSMETELRPGGRAFDHSLYHDALMRWRSHFPPERLKVIVFDDFSRDPSSVMRTLFEHVGVDPSAPVRTDLRHNESGVPRSAAMNLAAVRTLRFLRRRVVPRSVGGTGLGARFHRLFLRKGEPMPAWLRERLAHDFREDILRTSELIGRDLSHWR